MSDKARKLLKQAIKIYVQEDGAGSGGYKDAVADLLHLARKDKPFLKNYPVWDGKFPMLKYLVDEGYSIYEEERTNAELARLNRIPKKDLPLHLHDEWEDRDVRAEFEKRLKGL
jgi:hypothetical protein